MTWRCWRKSHQEKTATQLRGVLDHDAQGKCHRSPHIVADVVPLGWLMIWTSFSIVCHEQVAHNGNLTISNIGPGQSFFTIGEHWFPGLRGSFRKAGHGGACCLSLTRCKALTQGGPLTVVHKAWAKNDSLLVGVAHTSVNYRQWYLNKNVPTRKKAMVPHTHYASFSTPSSCTRPSMCLRAPGTFAWGSRGRMGRRGGRSTRIPS